jgi:uncharacterized integral membrane protein
VTDQPTSSGSDRPEEAVSSSPAPGDRDSLFTRASAAWVATGAALLFLVLLIIFILQNPEQVEVRYLGFTGSLSLGMALLIAAVAGGVVVAVAGVARVTQLRRSARRSRGS